MNPRPIAASKAMMRKAASNVHHDHLVMVPLIIMRGSLAEILLACTVGKVGTKRHVLLSRRKFQTDTLPVRSR